MNQDKQRPPSPFVIRWAFTLIANAIAAGCVFVAWHNPGPRLCAYDWCPRGIDGTQFNMPALAITAVWLFLLINSLLFALRGSMLSYIVSLALLTLPAGGLWYLAPWGNGQLSL